MYPSLRVYCAQYMTEPSRREAEFLLCAAPDGAVKVRVLFRKHLTNIFESKELSRSATVSKMEIVQSEGGPEVAREVELYTYSKTPPAEGAAPAFVLVTRRSGSTGSQDPTHLAAVIRL